MLLIKIIKVVIIKVYTKKISESTQSVQPYHAKYMYEFALYRNTYECTSRCELGLTTECIRLCNLWPVWWPLIAAVGNPIAIFVAPTRECRSECCTMDPYYLFIYLVLAHEFLTVCVRVFGPVYICVCVCSLQKGTTLCVCVCVCGILEDKHI